MARRRTTGPGISFFAFQDIITAVVGIFILITLIMVLELAQRVETASAEVPKDIRPVVETIESLQQQIEEMETQIQQRTAAMTQTAGINAFNVAEQTDQMRRMVQTLQARIKSSKDKQASLKSQRFAAESEAQQLSEQFIQTAGQRQKLDELSEQEKQIREQENVLLGDDSDVYRDVTEDGRYLVLITMSARSIVIRDALTRTVKTFSGADRLDDFEEWAAVIPVDRRHLMLRIQPGGEADFDTVQAAVKAAGAQYGFTVVGQDQNIRLGYEIEQTP